jgi:hypothetical protein
MEQDPMIEQVKAGKSTIPGSTMATDAQSVVESRAMALLNEPGFDETREQLRALFQADRNALLADQTFFIEQSIAEHCLHAALMAANETPRNPRFVWSIALAHNWMSLNVPGSRIGQDNPDNAYRFTYIDDGLSYRISGQFVHKAPGDFSLCALPAHVGEGIAADVRGFINRDTLDIDQDGNFEILLDATPTNGRRNHLCIAGAKVVMARDTLIDWSAERPSRLSIAPINIEPVDNFDPLQAAQRARFLTINIADFFLQKVQHGMCEVAPLNTVPAPVSSAGRGGLVTQTATLGYYRLGTNETLVLTIDPLGAHYLGVQLCDMWMLSYDYSQRSSSLNNHQALADHDGLIRMVISARDPGAYNWLDGSGNGLGTVLLRWHGIPADADFSRGARADIVNLDELKSFLPKETRYLSADQRIKQQQKRFRDYLNRLYQ